MNANTNRLLQSALVLTVILLASALPAQTTSISGDSTINQCETKSYTIGVQNNSGNTLSHLVIVARLENLTGFTYVSGTSFININGAGNIPLGNPAISGAYTGLCAAPTAPYLTWDVDTLAGVTTLLNGQTISITFDLLTDCSAVSGSLNTLIDYDISATPMCDNTGALNIQVLPGGLTIKKTPNVIPQEIGQDVTWTLTIENSGFGTIKNVVATDVLGAGLAYVSSAPAGSNSGQTTTWGAAEIPQLASMNPGQTVSIDITATVTACELLDNNADARWGCDAVTDCFNTADDGGTTTASVQRIVKTPLIDYTPPDITFTYCEDYVDVSFTISNIGDGRAHSIWTLVDFAPLTVSNISAGTVYNNTDKRFEHADPILPGGNYVLSFRLNYASWCGETFPARSLVWQKVYEDDCHQLFYPPVALSTINPPLGSASVAVSKAGAGAVIQIGDVITYTITSAYTGPLSCGSGPGSTGIMTVVDTIPNGFTVIDADGGTYVPGGDGTGGTITWTYTPPATLSKTITVQSPLIANCETYCNTIFTNSVAVSGADCCGCTLTANASETSAIECAEGVTSEKVASAPTQRCADTTYTNTYTFDGGSIATLNNLIFTEHAENQQVYNDNLSITLDGVDISGSVLMTDTTPGGSLVFDFSGAPATPLAGRVLVIQYNLTATAATVAACTNSTFYSWSSLSMGSAGSQCLADGVIHETTPVTIGSPSMSLGITGLGAIFHKCESQQITLTLRQTSTFNPKDVKLKLSGLNYYVIDPTNPAAITCAGDVTPIACLPTIDGNGDYIWTFNDLFTGQNQTATIVLDVQKRCTGTGDLVATAYFDDRCTDDATSDELCSVTATETPTLLLSGDLLIEKTPEVYYATTNTVQWVIYLTNRGTGTAYNVWVDDTLGAGLLYTSAVVDDMTGVTVTGNLNHSGSVINGATIAIADMTAGERRMITFTAQVIDCNNLTNLATASWGCIGVDCQVAVTDTSTVEIPAPNLINTNTITPSGGVNACASPDGFITLRNAGQVTCYNLQVTETLPAGLLYVTGTTRWRLNSGAWNGPNAAYDPSPTVSPLQWTSAQIPGLATSNPGDVIEINYDLTANCPFLGGDITVSTSYETPCGQVFNTANSVFTVAFRAPRITVTKTRANEPIGCGEMIEWTITVRNTSGYTLPIIWVEDTLDAAFTYTSSVGDPPYTSDNGTFDGVNRVAWELSNVNHNDTVFLTLRATSDSSPCSHDLDNTVRAWWGCGATDGSSETKPGEDAPDNNLCLATTGISVTRTETRQPSVGFLNIAVNPISLNACDDATELTVTISNPGPTDASNVDLVVTLPAGLTYIPGSAAVTCGGVLTDPAPNPTVSGSQLTFYDTSSAASNLCNLIQAAGGNDTVTLVFSVRSSCYTTANLGFNLYYYDCCGDTQYNTPASQQVTARYPALTVSKTPVSSQVACGADRTWNITVTNNGTGIADVVRVEDTLGDWLTYVGGSAGITPMGGQVFGWEINNLAAGGGTASFTITAQLSPDAPQASCAAALRQNNVRAIWGCGAGGDATDGNPNTQGYDCTTPAWANATAATLAMPDLVATAITPAISCTADGTFSGGITVTVRNQGDGIATGGFQVSVDDGNGWTGSGSVAGDLAAGATNTVTIDVTSWNPDCSPCTYNFTATADSTGAVCECNENNNVFGPQAYSPAIPDLEVISDTMAFSCASDGQYSISGSVTLRNAGCSGTLAQDVPMRFTLFSGAGCTGSQLAQWTQTFTGVSIAAGGTQIFTITNYTIVGNACTSASGCQFSIRTEADYNNIVCECDGTDNTLCSDKTFSIPDLHVVSDTLAISCNVDGGIRIQGDLVIANDGCGANFATNIPIRISVYNNNTACAGASGTLTFTQAGVNIPAGGTQTFTINRTMTRNLCTNSTGCQVALGVELDYTNVICECTNTNNNYCSPNKTVSIPDLQVTGDTLSVNCLQDGQVRVLGNVTIANTGCGAAVAGNLPVRVTLFSNTGCAGTQIAQWTETFAGVNIAAGGSQVFTITNRDIITNICANSTGCQVSLRIEADPAPSTTCECNGGNNTRCSNKTVSVPDLRVTAVTPSITCTTDGTLSGTVQVTVNNNGCGTANNLPVRLTSDCGYTFTDQTVAALAAGASTTLTYSFTPDISRCTCTFTAAADPDNVICECDGSNNSLAAAPYTSPVPDLTISEIDFSNVTCASDNISGSVTVTVNNQGCGTAGNFQVALATDGCLTFSNQTVVSLASGASTTLTFTISGSWADCADASCLFTATVDAPGTVCEYDGTNNTRVETYDSTLPDLVAGTITPSAACVSDGSISGSISVQISNSGNGPVNSDFRIQVNDGQGWTAQPWFNADLGGTLPIAAGGNATVSIPWSRGFTATPYVCSFPAIAVTLDSSNAICECSSGNNSNSGSYSLPFPNLNAVSVNPACSSDGSYSVAVAVNNNGCGTASNAVVRLSDNDGQTADQTVTLAAGATQTLTYAPWPADGNPATLTFTTTIDPGSAICELSGTDNTNTTNFSRGNLNLVSITPACNSDGTFQISLVIQNNGSAAINSDFIVRLSDNDSHSVDQNFTAIGGTLPLNNGTQQTVVFSGWTVDCAPTTINFSATLDPGNQVCESNSGDNTNTGTITINDLQAVSVVPATSCSVDGSITGTLVVTVANRGGNAINTDFRVLVDDGQGWTSELFYNADLGGTLPIAPGASASVTCNWTRSFTATPYVCSFPAVTVTVDSQNAICECTNGNNTSTASYSLPYPNLNLVSVTPTCSSDGNYSIAVTVSNNGCGIATDAVVRLSDDDGQTADQTVTLAAGASQTLTYSPWPADGNPAALAFTAVVDPGSAICELSGSDNSMAVTYSNPNLHIVSITPACVADGSYQVTMVIENNGAGDINSDFIVRLADNDGHSVDQNFTASGGTLPLAAGSQQSVIFTSWTVDCNPTTINFSATLDPTDLVCESNNGDNTHTGTITINNLQAVSVVPVTSCSVDGSITGTLVVTVTNSGGNVINTDFRILVDDGQGWTSELFYNADLGGTLPIAPGASASVTCNWTRAFTAAPYVCSFAGITATADSQNAICECTGTDNQASGTYTLPFPDLAITSVASAVVCLGDGSLTGTTVTVANTGCADASNVLVRLSSDCGLIFTDQTISLAAGESRDVVFNFTSGIVGCTCNFIASIDPDNLICELDGGNNTGTGTLLLPIPDITVAGDKLAAVCSTDGTIQIDGRISLDNLGCGPVPTESIGVRFTLYGEAGCRGTVLDQWTQVFSGVNIAAGGSQNFAVRAHEISQDLCSLAPGCRLSVRVETDYGQKICEWDGTNNDRCANIELACLDLSFSDVSWTCDASGAIQWTLNVTNQGNSTANNALVRIYDETPALIFENRVSIAAGATVTLRFTSAAYAPGIDHSFRLVIDENNVICECNGQNNVRIVTVNCPTSGEPRLEIKKTCPPAQQPGGIYRFEIEIRNSGNGSIDDVRIEDVLPAPLQYVGGSSALDGKAIADPSGTTILTWTIGNLEAGASHLMVYSLIAPADTDPGRYCNQAQVRGTAQDGRRIESEKATCCIILRREAAGCCLVIEERPMGFVQYPELALAYIEPYFHTEKAMFASYAALHLWENIDFEKGSLPDFVRERLKNYALSNVEELYFHSRLGLTLPDGSLWLSYAGDYPQKETGRWKEKNTMRSMTPAQVAFELLAMNKAMAREEKAENKDKLDGLIARKLDFVAAHVADLPERWEFADGRAVRQKEKANLYDRASLYLSLVELGKAGRTGAAALGLQLRAELASLDNERFDSGNLREECLFILALKENGEDELAAKKIHEFERLFHAGKSTPADLPAYAMAVYADFKAGGTLFLALFTEMKKKFYSSDLGLFAEPQADFRQKIGLEALAPLILAFESQMPGEKDLFATTLYRTIEEAGLFLKKTNLQVQRPPLNLIKNYPFTQEMLPLLTFIKSNDDMAPIFSETAMVHSPHTALSAENLLPVTYTKVFAPQYETDTAQIGLLSFSLQQLGKDLDGSAERVIREQGRSLDQSGKKYVRLLLASHAGLEWQGDVFLSTAKLAVKGSRPTGVNLEALDSKNEFSTEVLANKLVAEKIFMKNPGPDRQRLEGSLEMQEKLVSQFKTIGFVPASFTAFKKNEAGELVMVPSREKADKITVAKLQYALPDAFWQKILEKETGVLKAQDLLFISLAPQNLRSVFEKELRQFMSGRARDFAEIAAQVVTRTILELDSVPTRKKLAAIWDHETGLPLSSSLENMNRGQVYRYQPWQILLYLLATKDNDDLQFKRTLDYFTYLLESEWGMNWSKEYGTLPAAEYWLVKESPREYPEPGDLLNFNVRVENRCPNGLASAGDLPSLFIKAEFTPSLVFAGTELPANLSLFKEFSWGYQGLQKDSYLEYAYQALIPREFKENYLQGSIWVRGYTGYQPFGPESASGDYCENFARTGQLQLIPQDLIPGLVYADRNLNGRNDAGETGIDAIRFKDNRGRLFRSNAEGRFFVPAGQENVAVQIDFRSIPEDLVLISPPTQLTNRSQHRELTYALVPCRPLRGFVYRDDNRNGRYDENEPRLAGIRLKAGDKEGSSGSDGGFIMYNLPDLWRELLKVDKDQPLYSDSLALVKIQITSEDKLL